MKKAFFLSVLLAEFGPGVAMAGDSIDWRGGAQLIYSGGTAETGRILDPKNRIEGRCEKLRIAAKGGHSQRGGLSSPPFTDEVTAEFLIDCKVPRLDSDSLVRCGL